MSSCIGDGQSDDYVGDVMICVGVREWACDLRVAVF